jgi:hypothetical protein
MADTSTRPIAVPECLRRDFEVLADKALTVLLLVQDLVRDGDRLQDVAEYLADTEDLPVSDMDAWKRLDAYLDASGHRMFSEVLKVTYEQLRESRVIGGSTLSGEGRRQAEATIAMLLARRFEAEAGR